MHRFCRNKYLLWNSARINRHWKWKDILHKKDHSFWNYPYIFHQMLFALSKCRKRSITHCGEMHWSSFSEMKSTESTESVEFVKYYCIQPTISCVRNQHAAAGPGFIDSREDLSIDPKSCFSCFLDFLKFAEFIESLFRFGKSQCVFKDPPWSTNDIFTVYRQTLCRQASNKLYSWQEMYDQSWI